MSDFGFDRVFDDMIKLTESLLQGQGLAANSAPDVEQERANRDELIERKDSFDYIVDAPGCEETQLAVSLQEDRIEVKGPDFIARKVFPSKVEPDSAASNFRNGVLSVSVKKK